MTKGKKIELTPEQLILQKLDDIGARLDAVEKDKKEKDEEDDEDKDSKKSKDKKKEEKKDSDSKLDAAAKALRLSLKGIVKQEKLDSYSLDQLITIADLKEDIDPQANFMNPPTGSGSRGDQKEDNETYVPEQFRAHMENGEMLG